ncbi:MAG: putative transrane protein [Proteobacteria bacterium]|nr:putative transrane protein [Pseudomonadota bacterium]
MSLITCCDHCRTVFRVTPEQLQAHGGQVRCGRCMQTFDALVALVPVDVPSSPPSPPEPPLSEPPPAAAAITDPVPAAAEDPGALLDILPEPPLAQPESSPESLPDTPSAAHELEPRIKPVAVPRADAENPFIDVPAAQPEPAPRRPWLIAASVLLGLVLAAQAIYFYRGEIAARQPLARQWLNTACAQIGCIVALPQSPKAILIEASDLQSVDPARPNRIQLTATLRNHADHDVAYPALDLVLTNANDHTLARRIFLPVEYLGSGRDPRAGMAANAELTVRLGLDTGSLGAAGFRLAVLSAPQR